MACERCSNEISIYVTECPHCGWPGLYPNVNAASLPEERQALQSRYSEALEDAREAGVADTVQQFEEAVDRSWAVMNVKIGEAERLASSESELRATFYGMADSRVPRARPPAGTDWNRVREVVDTALFTDAVKRHIRFAALSLTPEGLRAYGPCTLVCATPMIAHRASAFEKNSCQFFIDRGGVNLGVAVEIPQGVRSTWVERGKLAVAKLASRLVPSTTRAEFADILATRGATTDDDEFIEVHIFGPMTVRSLEKVRIDDSATGLTPPGILLDLRDNLTQLGVIVDQP